MRLIKSINHNAAIGVDGNGAEVIVFGKGIGFPAMPYVLEDTSRVQRTFRDVNPQLAEVVASIPEATFLVTASVVEMAERELDLKLNPNLAFTLADHLNFAIQRLEGGIEIATPLAYDVAHLYPREAAVARQALVMIGDQLGVAMPESEVTPITLHLITAATEAGDIRITMVVSQIAQELTTLLQERLDVQLDQTSYNFSRFLMHLRYLVRRLSEDQQKTAGAGGLLGKLAEADPEIYATTLAATEYLASEWGWTCTEEETLYLMTHIYRLCR